MNPKQPVVESVADSLADELHVDPSNRCLLVIPADDLLGISYLCDLEEDGTRYCAHVIKKIVEMNRDAEIERVKFLVDVGKGVSKEIVAYNELLDHINRDQLEQEQEDRLWCFKAISDHQGPLSTNDICYKGSKYNVLVDWEDGTSTWEPLHIIATDDPVTCTEYAMDNDLLDVEGWKHFRRLAKKDKQCSHMLHQLWLNSVWHSLIYKFGIQVPCNHKEVAFLDEKNGNTKWKDAQHLELSQIMKYETFDDRGPGHKIIPGYQHIHVHLVYDMKHDLRHKARLVVGGNMTDPPRDSVYSGVISLRSLHICIFLAELNGLATWAADVGNAYLEAKTKEKVCFVAGPEFEDFKLAGHTLIIIKALYGLRSSSVHWHDHFADTLHDIGFIPSRADDDIWMCDMGNHYEYLCIYVDDIAYMSHDPQKLFDLLKDEKKYGYKLKGDGPILYHLGSDFKQDLDGTLAWGAETYIDKMMANYECMFGVQPKKRDWPLPTDCHPELNVTPELEDDGIKIYQSLIGALQWTVTLCHFDVYCATMTLSHF